VRTAAATALTLPTAEGSPSEAGGVPLCQGPTALGSCAEYAKTFFLGEPSLPACCDDLTLVSRKPDLVVAGGVCQSFAWPIMLPTSGSGCAVPSHSASWNPACWPAFQTSALCAWTCRDELMTPQNDSSGNWPQMCWIPWPRLLGASSQGCSRLLVSRHVSGNDNVRG